MSKGVEHRVVLEVWDGKGWRQSQVVDPSENFGGMSSLDDLKNYISKLSYKRPEDPHEGDYGDLYVQRREVTEWERV